MKIKDILKNEEFSLSFEVFPPKTDTAFQSVEAAVTEIAALRPAFMSVTYGAGGGASRYTLDMAKTVEEKSGVSTIAHLTCVSSTKETVRQKIKEMREYGIENVLALRGDLTPEMENSDRSKWDYRYAIDLIHELKESGADFCIGGACYPEVHPESVNQKEDIRRLKEKVDAGCDFGMYPDAMMQAGIAYATDQIIDLYANGVTNVHVYSMNKPEVARCIQSNLSNILGKS